jgi:polyamine oxidase
VTPDSSLSSRLVQANNYTFDPAWGGFSEENLFDLDQRGFSTIIQSEADEFIQPEQLRLSALVRRIKYSEQGVSVLLDGGEEVSGDYAICTFSLGVLQNDDVSFDPVLPCKSLSFTLPSVANI